MCECLKNTWRGLVSGLPALVQGSMPFWYLPAKLLLLPSISLVLPAA